MDAPQVIIVGEQMWTQEKLEGQEGGFCNNPVNKG